MLPFMDSETFEMSASIVCFRSVTVGVLSRKSLFDLLSLFIFNASG